MYYRKQFCLVVFALAAAAICAGNLLRSEAQSPVDQNTGRARRTDNVAQPSPTPPRPTGETTLPGDEVVRVETNLTSLFFTAADKQNRYISDLNREDIRILEDGQPQQVFTFQQNADLPLSLAILLDTSRSEERTLP